MRLGGRRFLLSFAIIAAAVCLALGLTMPIIKLTSFYFWSSEYSLISTVAVLLRDGFEVVMRVGADLRVAQTKVRVLSRDGDRVALEGLGADARVVERGAAFLSDGDTVRVVKP